MDMASELASLGSIFAIPAVLAVALGTGLGRGNVGYSLMGGMFALAFGVALAKWLSISLGALTRKKRTRGETVLAIVGAAVGFGGAFAGQLAPMMLENKELWKALHWSPVGAAVTAVAGAPHGVPFDEYLLALLCLSLYTLLLVLVTFWIARRSALGMGGSRKAVAHDEKPDGVLRGWRVPLVSEQVGAVLEKELRYAMRNAQLRMLGIMPLVLVGLKMMNTRGPMSGEGASRAIAGWTRAFGGYTDGLLAALGILYIFMLFSTLYCNSFAYEGSGMRSWILSPIERRSILLGKNINVLILCAFFCGLFLMINEVIFHDLSFNALVFVTLAFVLFGAFFAHVGNWLSIHFPKRMRFGKRMNTSGVAGLLLLPIVAVSGAAVFGTVAAAYTAHSYAVKYGTLAVLATVAVAIYFALLPVQGRELARHERDILDAVSGKDDV
jgi:predicted nucleic acid-binding Zn ribbon protein